MKMRKIWTKIVGIVFGFFGIGMLTSCYGTMPNDADSTNFVGGTVSEEGEEGKEGEASEKKAAKALCGIRVAAVNEDGRVVSICKTNENGRYGLSIGAGKFTLIFTDIDGGKDGTYAGKQVPVDAREYGAGIISNVALQKISEK